MLTVKRKYKEGYKPHVCTVSCTFFYIRKKDMEKYERLKLTNRNREKDRLVNELVVHEILAVVDCENKIPTIRMKNSLSKRIWRMFSLKGDLEDYNTNIKNIKTIMNHGRVNYRFDERIH